MDELAALRAEYAHRGLDEADLPADPMDAFRAWFAEARDAGFHEPNAMVVSTVSAEGVPSSRLVLLKVFDERGFGFFTNLASLKAVDLAARPECALLFPWHPVQRQVRVVGRASLLPRDEVAAYFAGRPRGAKLGAWASRQSEVVASRAELEAAYVEAQQRFPEEVPVPEEWGGYLVEPRELELWQGRPDRMHDRVRYRRRDGRWVRERLAP